MEMTVTLECIKLGLMYAITDSSPSRPTHYFWCSDGRGAVQSRDLDTEYARIREQFADLDPRISQAEGTGIPYWSEGSDLLDGKGNILGIRGEPIVPSAGEPLSLVITRYLRSLGPVQSPLTFDPIVRVKRVLVYEGPSSWVERTLARGAVPANGTSGTTGSITSTTFEPSPVPATEAFPRGMSSEAP